MLTPAILYVFSSQRARNAFYAKQPEGFLPTAWSVQEFYSQISFVQGLIKIPQSARQALLMEAIREVAKEGARVEGLVVFEQSFLGYLDGSGFVARFFNELAKFGMDIAQIPTKDIYGDYQHHLEVLERIYHRYKAFVQTRGFYDPILGVRPTLMPQVLSKFARIEFYLEGFLSKFEQEILLEIAQHAPLLVHITSDRYNPSCLRFLGVHLKEEHSYILDMQALSRGANPIVQESPQAPFNPDRIHIYAFEKRLDQVGLALQRVQEWLNEGLDSSTLAIITPSAEILSALKLLDTGHNLNFARGQEAQEVFAPYFTALEALKTHAFPVDLHALDALKEQCHALLTQLYPNIPPPLKAFHKDFFQTYAFILPALQSYGPTDLLELYMRALKDLRIDDSTGGKIKVLDVLECRGLCFERVVILDFNDHLVPHIKDSDLFLNTFTRTALGIPTLQDKENLQKHYYYQIIKNSARVDIAYSTAQNATPSKMLAELGLNTRANALEDAFKLFANPRPLHNLEETCTGCIPADLHLSVSKLRDFTECKRRFYLKYLAKLTPPPQEDTNQGSLLHQALQAYYSSPIYASTQAPIHAKTLLESLQGLEEWGSLNALERFNMEVVVGKLAGFFARERVLLQGARVVACEQKFETSFAGFTFKGMIDRLDLCADGTYRLLDYKFKSQVKPAHQDYQLAIYTLGARALGYPSDRLSASLYDLRKGELVEKTPQDIASDLEALTTCLQSLQGNIDFSQTTERQACRFCPYGDICGI
ncbi:PD-(D/E)XK nuclease family protein [Helicobacter vulpis]|uniref:PD-(D/E)XK nuclease family protein n=1 Tax=Helicobacter vulpis TaxID=2316076 RepID=UPI000EB235A4|nr:PD-(D/E)XK nuclease family protein [Helicobacter vulpis]